MPPVESKTGARGASGEHSAAPAEKSGIAVAQCCEWLQWAATQIDACMAGDKFAMNDLLACLADLIGSAPRTAVAPHDPANVKLSAIIMAAQAHDRVMQGLVHVTESLRALRGQLGDAQLADSADSWRTLRAKQFRAFSMPEERELFARMVAHGDEALRTGTRIGTEPAESFSTDDGLFES